MIFMQFGKWNIADGSAKIEKARSAECTPLGYIKEPPFAVFSGSHGIYNTNLESCNCYSFSNENEPCKHMIRLAMEIGLLEMTFETDITKVKFPRESAPVTKTVYVDVATGEVSKERPLPNGVLNGYSFVITGNFPNVTREEMIQYINGHGGRVSGSVSRKTSFVVAGEDPGTKLDKAMSYGIPVLAYSDLLRMTAPTDEQTDDTFESANLKER